MPRIPDPTDPLNGKTILSFIANQDPWFRMSIPDACWFLDVSEHKIRRVISDLRLLVPPKTKIPSNDEMAKGNICFFYTTTPYFIYRDELLILAEVIGRTTLPAGGEFERRMKSIRSGFADIDAAMKGR